MKITKSVFALVFSIIFICLTVSGCKKDDKSYEDSDMPVLKIGSDEYTPHFYIDENGSFAGIDVELAEDVADVGLHRLAAEVQLCADLGVTFIGPSPEGSMMPASSQV